MLRTTLTGLCLALGALACDPSDAVAAGRGSALGGHANPAPRGVVQARPGLRHVEAGRGHRPAHHRYGRHHGRFHGGLPYGYDPGFRLPSAAPYEAEVEPPKPVDPFAFANLPVRAGIPYPPTPEPTIYRLEGRRDRPVTRVIRIGEAQAKGQTTRHVHAETGAVILTVPRR